MNHAPSSLPAWMAPHLAFRRRFLEVGGHSLHLVDHGAGPAVLLLHGNPTWSFLWRHVIEDLAGRGFRVLAPDLIGLGLSAKPRSLSVHSLEAHIGWIRDAIEQLDPGELVLCGQDWGGPIAAGVAAREPARVRGAVFANTALLRPRIPGRATIFHRFSRLPILSHLAFRLFNLPVSMMHRVQGDPDSIGPLESRAYRWPLRRVRDRVAPLALARMVPLEADHPSVGILEETDRWFREFGGPMRLVWGMRDPILGRALKRMREVRPDIPVVETEAGHFLQEEVPHLLAEAIAEVASDAFRIA